MIFPEEYIYTKEHLWLDLSKIKVKIGLTVYVEHKAGTVTFFNFPEVGTAVDEKGTLFLMETIKTSVEIFSPVKGKIVKSNRELLDEPILFNVNPFKNWMVELEIEEEDVTVLRDKYLNAEEYEKYIKTLSQKSRSNK